MKLLVIIIAIFLVCSAACFLVAFNRGFTFKDSIKFSFYGFFLGPIAIWILLNSTPIKDTSTASLLVNTAPEHAVLVYLSNRNTDLSKLGQLEEQLEQLLNDSGTGEYDGNEIAINGSNGILYMYGPDAESLFSAIHPVLEEFEFLNGSKVVLRFGPSKDGVRQREVILGI